VAVLVVVETHWSMELQTPEVEAVLTAVLVVLVL
jgi:hypothetical protein